MNCLHGVDVERDGCARCTHGRIHVLIRSALALLGEWKRCEHPQRLTIRPGAVWCTRCGAVRDGDDWRRPTLRDRAFALDRELRSMDRDGMIYGGDSDAKNVIPMKPRR